MAITRAQQAKQMLQNGGRIGFFRGAQADASAGKGAMSPGTSMSGGVRGGPSPGASNPRRPGGSEVFTPAASKSLNIDRGEIDRIRNRRFLVEQPTLGMRVSDFIGGLPSIKFLKFLGEKGGTPVDAQGFGSGQGGGPQAMASAFIPAYIRAGFNTQEEYDEFLASQREDASVDDKIERSLAFKADGGPIGGEFDFESARQMYGLGKLVKKVTKTVKKIAKSPIGKAALLYAGTAGLGAFGAGAAKAGSGFGIFSPGNVFKNIVSSGKNLGLLKRITGVGKDGTEYLTRVGPLANLGVGSLIAGTSLLAGLLTPEQEEEAQELSRGEGIDIEAARNSILARAQGNFAGDFRARRFRAEEGGKAEPVAKKTMPLLDMDGQEMDLRAEGGRIGYSDGTIEGGAMMSKEEMKKLAKSPLYKGFKKMYGIDPSMAKENTAYDEKFSQFEELFKKGFQEGGDVEPVAKKTMPLLDMGGKEMDLRAEGGFVPIGRMEKADDVPARLSKNEFVFTADAVRNAGEGDVDKGAEVMYNMMKNLESGGDVSEESQGLEGARKMFQTSQRLEEVL